MDLQNLTLVIIITVIIVIILVVVIIAIIILCVSPKYTELLYLPPLSFKH